MIHKGKKTKVFIGRKKIKNTAFQVFSVCFYFLLCSRKFPSHEKRIHENLTHTGIGK